MKARIWKRWELGPGLQAEGLRDVDLDVVDEVAVPDRLEEAVGEPERQDVEGGLLAEEVVDAEDLVLVEDAMEMGVQRLGALEVDTERLLHDHAGVLDQVCLGEHRDGGQC
jgi:hypothetical protein